MNVKHCRIKKSKIGPKISSNKGQKSLLSLSLIISYSNGLFCHIDVLIFENICIERNSKSCHPNLMNVSFNYPMQCHTGQRLLPIPS